MVRRKSGLGLSGGGVRGFGHTGVLPVLAENNIPIDMIAVALCLSFRDQITPDSKSVIVAF